MLLLGLGKYRTFQIPRYCGIDFANTAVSAVFAVLTLSISNRVENPLFCNQFWNKSIIGLFWVLSNAKRYESVENWAFRLLIHFAQIEQYFTDEELVLNLWKDQLSVNNDLNGWKLSHNNQRNIGKIMRMCTILQLLLIPQIPHLEYRGIAVSVLNTAPRGIAVFAQP